MRVLKYIYYRETEQRNTGSLPSEKERQREELVKADKAEETMRGREVKAIWLHTSGSGDDWKDCYKWKLGKIVRKEKSGWTIHLYSITFILYSLLWFRVMGSLRLSQNALCTGAYQGDTGQGQRHSTSWTGRACKLHHINQVNFMKVKLTWLIWRWSIFLTKKILAYKR